MPRRAFPPQWHLRIATIGGVRIQAHANVARAWRLTTGAGTTIAVIDDGIDVDHEEFSTANKIVAPRSFGKVSSDDPRPGESDDHGTAAAGVACAAGRFGAAGVAPDARLMPLRSSAGLGSQDEADTFAWAADQALTSSPAAGGLPTGAGGTPAIRGTPRSSRCLTALA